MNNTREKAFYLIGFPAGHGAIDAGTSALWIIAPAIALSMDLSKTQVGLIFSVIAIAAGVTHIPAGLVGETRFKRVFLLSTLWWVAGAYLVASLIPSYWLLLFFLALASSGAAAWHPIGPRHHGGPYAQPPRLCPGSALRRRIVHGGPSAYRGRAPSCLHGLAKRDADHRDTGTDHGGGLPSSAPMDPSVTHRAHVTEGF